MAPLSTRALVSVRLAGNAVQLCLPLFEQRHTPSNTGVMLLTIACRPARYGVDQHVEGAHCGAMTLFVNEAPSNAARTCRCSGITGAAMLPSKGNAAQAEVAR